MSWNDKVAFITGASQGIGRSCARVLAGAGARVVVASRNLDNLRRVADEINRGSETVRALTLVLDVAQEAEIKESFRKANEQFGNINILVNNAGIARDYSWFCG